MAKNSQRDRVIDVNAALAFTAGDRDMLNTLAELFLEEGPPQLRAIDVSIQAQDAVGIGKATHVLKGSIAIFAADQAIEAACELERAAAHDASKIADAWRTLRHEMHRLLADAKRLCPEPSA